MKLVFTLLGSLLILARPALAFESPEALQDGFVAALESNDAAALAACYSGDAVNFPVDAMMGIGPDSVLTSWENFFMAYKVHSISLSDTHMETHGEIAFAWGLFKMKVEPAAGGEPVEMTGRYMDVARNIDGTWLYIADHASMPLPAEEEPETE